MDYKTVQNAQKLTTSFVT